MNGLRPHQQILDTGEERAREFEHSADSQELWGFFDGIETVLDNPNRSNYSIPVQKFRGAAVHVPKEAEVSKGSRVLCDLFAETVSHSMP